MSSLYIDISTYINNNIKYNQKLANEMDNNDVKGSDNQSASYTFNKKEGVCLGISELYASMCRGIGLPVRVVTGTLYKPGTDRKVKIGGHAWNEILVNGKWSIFDVANKNPYGNPENYQAKYVLEFK